MVYIGLEEKNNKSRLSHVCAFVMNRNVLTKSIHGHMNILYNQDINKRKVKESYCSHQFLLVQKLSLTRCVFAKWIEAQWRCWNTEHTFGKEKCWNTAVFLPRHSLCELSFEHFLFTVVTQLPWWWTECFPFDHCCAEKCCRASAILKKKPRTA